MLARWGEHSVSLSLVGLFSIGWFNSTVYFPILLTVFLCGYDIGHFLWNFSFVIFLNCFCKLIGMKNRKYKCELTCFMPISAVAFVLWPILSSPAAQYLGHGQRSCACLFWVGMQLKRNKIWLNVIYRCFFVLVYLCLYIPVFMKKMCTVTIWSNHSPPPSPPHNVICILCNLDFCRCQVCCNKCFQLL